MATTTRTERTPICCSGSIRAKRNQRATPCRIRRRKGKSSITRMTPSGLSLLLLWLQLTLFLLNCCLLLQTSVAAVIDSEVNSNNNDLAAFQKELAAALSAGGTTDTKSSASSSSSSASASSGAGFFESLWEKLKNQAAQQQQQLQQQQQSATRPRQMTRRRALYEHSIQSHYSQYLQQQRQQEQEQHPATFIPQEETSSTAASAASSDFVQETPDGCLWYNEKDASFWSYLWCPNTSLHQMRLVQKSDSSGVWFPEISHSLGSIIVESDNNEDNSSWKALLRLVRNVQTIQEMQFFSMGDACGDSTDKKQRRGLVVVRNQDCGQVKRIVKVEEPFECDYIVHVCIPSLDATSSIQNKNDDILNPVEVIANENTQENKVSADNEEEEEQSATEDDLLSNDERQQDESAPAAHDDDDSKSKSGYESDNSSSEPQQQQQAQDRLEDEQRRTRDVQRVLKQYLHHHKTSSSTINDNDRTTPLHIGMAPFPPSRQESNLELVKSMFRHAYDSYMYNAFPSSELKPLSCQPGTFHLVRLPALTLIDTLDTLVVMQNYTEFARSVERLKELDRDLRPNGGLFAVNQNVSVFETNIRVLGGLLSAHQLAEAYLGNVVLERDVWDDDGNVKMGAILDSTSEDMMEDSTFKDEWLGKPGTCPTQKPVCGDIGFTDSGIVEDFDFQQTFDAMDKNYQCTNTTTLKPRQSSSSIKKTYWKYDGVLLQLARDLGERLLPAFSTKTGIPYGTVNLLYGIPPGETTIASLAGGGTLTLEMELLSRMTGDEAFGQAAKLASRALWMRRSPKLNLLGKHIDVHRGEWTETLSGIGSNSDSFYEYLIKHYILFPEDSDFWTMLVSVYNGVHNDTRLGEWYADVDMNMGVRTGARRVFESLMAFYPGMQILLGELSPAARTLNSFFMVREYLGFLPERFNYGQWQVDGSGAGHHPLRPELLESCYFVHRATSGLGGMPRHNHSSVSTGWLWAADFALHTLQDLTYAKCGYATVKDLSPTTTGSMPRDSSLLHHVRLVDEMPSFFLSETLKYLYLVFDDDNILHTDTEREWVFTTEAHPIHHVGSTNQQSDRKREREWLEGMKEKLQSRLEQRLEKKHELVEIRRPVMSAALNSNKKQQEKWAEKSPSSVYAHHLTLSEKDTVQRKLDRKQIKKAVEVNRDNDVNPTKFKQPFLGPLHPAVRHEISDEENFVHLAFEYQGLGNGASLMKSCPNFHNSALIWVRALNGGAVDYSEVYVSSASNDESTATADELKNGLLMSGLEAAAHYGTGLYLGTPSDGAEPTCKLATSKDLKAKKGTRKPSLSSHGVERVNVGELGDFEIAVFDGGTGFYSRRVETDEAVTATLYSEKDLDNDMNEFVMVYLQMPVPTSDDEEGDLDEISRGSWRTSWKSIFKRNGERQKEKEQEFDRSVVFTNANSDAFVCTVTVVKKILLRDQAETEEEVFIEDEELLAEYPCAPALFGPTQMHRLTEAGGLEVEAELRAPPESYSFGCLEEDEANEELATGGGGLQLVRRGKCTFQEKAARRRDAEGVIVVNNLDADLFLMARGTDEGESPVDLPPTVLVIGHDGKEMQSLIEQHAELVQSVDAENVQESIVGRIQLTPQNARLDDGVVVSDTEEIDWPLVISKPGTIQVFAPSGWGVQAIDTGNMMKTGNNRWQLFLLNHDIDE